MKIWNLDLLNLNSMAKWPKGAGQILESLHIDLAVQGLGTFILKGGDEPVGRNSVLSNAPFLACLVVTSVS